MRHDARVARWCSLYAFMSLDSLTENNVTFRQFAGGRKEDHFFGLGSTLHNSLRIHFTHPNNRINPQTSQEQNVACGEPMWNREEFAVGGGRRLGWNLLPIDKLDVSRTVVPGLRVNSWVWLSESGRWSPVRPGVQTDAQKGNSHQFN